AAFSPEEREIDERLANSLFRASSQTPFSEDELLIRRDLYETFESLHRFVARRGRGSHAEEYKSIETFSQQVADRLREPRLNNYRSQVDMTQDSLFPSGPSAAPEGESASGLAGRGGSMFAAHTGSPLAARMRPQHLDEVLGQDHLLASGKPLRRVVEGSGDASVILYGPPG